MGSLLVPLLIDAYGIYPKHEVLVDMTEMSKSRFDVDGD
jgi:hypothetical protein